LFEGETENVRTFALEYHVDAIRSGHYISALQPILTDQFIRTPGSNSTDPGNVGENEWLTPFWVMIFDAAHSPPPTDLDESIQASSYSKYIETIFDVVQISLKAPIPASYVKIQRVGIGRLCLAEVEVFEEKVIIEQRKCSPLIVIVFTRI
jgi:hypothetical protein